MLRHAVLGSGGIGGLIAAALGRARAPVVLLMQEQTRAGYDGSLYVESLVLGDFEVAVPAASQLNRDVDVLWVAVKATQLEQALALAPADEVGEATVLPLLNGVDHIELLRARYRHVIPGAIRVESERQAGWRIRQSSPFLRVELAGGEHVAADLRAAGIETSVREDERTLLWEKLAFLAPVALATTALDTPLGGIRADPRYRRCQEEALAVAAAEGAQLDPGAIRALAEGAPDTIRSSMQKDVAAGRPPELDAIAGPIIRAGQRHRLPTPATSELASLIRQRIGQ